MCSLIRVMKLSLFEVTVQPPTATTVPEEGEGELLSGWLTRVDEEEVEALFATSAQPEAPKVEPVGSKAPPPLEDQRPPAPVEPVLRKASPPLEEQRQPSPVEPVRSKAPPFLEEQRQPAPVEPVRRKAPPPLDGLWQQPAVLSGRKTWADVAEAESLAEAARESHEAALTAAVSSNRWRKSGASWPNLQRIFDSAFDPR